MIIFMYVWIQIMMNLCGTRTSRNAHSLNLHSTPLKHTEYQRASHSSQHRIVQYDIHYILILGVAIAALQFPSLSMRGRILCGVFKGVLAFTLRPD